MSDQKNQRELVLWARENRDQLARLERIRLHYQLGDKFELNEGDTKYMHMMSSMYAKLCEGTGQVTAIRMVADEFEVTVRQCQNVYHHALELHGQIEVNQKKGYRAILTANYFRLIEREEQSENPDTDMIKKLLDSIGKINQVDKPDKEEGEEDDLHIEIDHTYDASILFDKEDEDDDELDPE